MKQQVLCGQHSTGILVNTATPKRELTVMEGPYTARLLAPDDAALLLCWQLRYRYFVQERGWVSPGACFSGEERDRYDQHAWHLAVLKDEQIVAYLRMLPWRTGVGFMLEDDFQTLLPASCSTLPRHGAVELSRLVCCPRSAAFQESGAPQAVELLFKLMYQVAKAEQIEHLHIVVEAGWLRPFDRRFGLPFTPLGEVQVLAGGTRTIAATATLSDLQAALSGRWPDKYAWYEDGNPRTLSHVTATKSISVDTIATDD